jgi:hypothetical protein
VWIANRVWGARLKLSRRSVSAVVRSFGGHRPPLQQSANILARAKNES